MAVPSCITSSDAVSKLLFCPGWAGLSLDLGAVTAIAVRTHAPLN